MPTSEGSIIVMKKDLGVDASINHIPVNDDKAVHEKVFIAEGSLHIIAGNTVPTGV